MNKRKLEKVVKMINKYLVGKIDAEFNSFQNDVIFYWFYQNELTITKIRIEVFEISTVRYIVELVIKKLFVNKGRL